MPEYSVSWVIDGIDADTYEEAARKAKAMREDPHTSADVYEVTQMDDPAAETAVVDLSLIDGRPIN